MSINAWPKRGEVQTVDLSIQPVRGPSRADFLPELIADFHPEGRQAVFCGDRLWAIAAMAQAFKIFLPERADLLGAIGVGSYDGMALITPAMQALAVGIPKVMVSTISPGDIADYVGGSDISLFSPVINRRG